MPLLHRTHVLRRLLPVLALATAIIPIAAPSPAHAAPVKCNGLDVTVEGATSGRDVIMGTEGDDVIHGLGGNDTIYGGGGDDTICGGGGKDKIHGDEGNDVLFGGTGDDRLKGGPGDDDLRGHAGNDRLFGHVDTDVIRGARGSDACRGETTIKCEMTHRWGHDPEEWRPLVEKHFGGLTDEAMVVMACESAGEPFAKNPRSSASGLFQFLPGTWDRWNPRTPGWEGESVFHPEANIATAKRLVDASVEEGHDEWWQWSCKP